MGSIFQYGKVSFWNAAECSLIIIQKYTWHTKGMVKVDCLSIKLQQKGFHAAGVGKTI